MMTTTAYSMETTSCSSICASGLDNDGDGAYDDMVGVGETGVNFDGSACDPAAYDIDSNDDNDDWSDVDEILAAQTQWTRRTSPLTSTRSGLRPSGSGRRQRWGGRC